MSKSCGTVVLTAVFGRKDKLQQPESGSVPHKLANCYFAIVDEESSAFLQKTAPPSVLREGRLDTERIGVWRLLTLRNADAPYASPRRTSRVPKLLPFRLFPHANYSLWVDGKLRLLADPASLVRRFLKAPRASLSLPRNFKRDHIDEEMEWIRGTLASEPAKLKRAAARAVEAQWAFYGAEQNRTHGADARSTDEADSAARVAPPTAWTQQTACAEGAMILADLRSPLARCVLCAWFNEWHRFGERDQLSFSYVLHAMGLTPPPEPPPGERADKKSARHEAARGVHLWSRRDHWHYKRPKNEPKRKPFVKYMGHGGCQHTPVGQLPNPGCPGALAKLPRWHKPKDKQLA